MTTAVCESECGSSDAIASDAAPDPPPPSSHVIGAPRVAPGPMSWSTWPARDRPGPALGASVIIGSLAWLAAGWLPAGFPAPVWTGLIVVGFAAALHRFFLPASAAIDADGIHRRSAFGARSLGWSEARTVLTAARSVRVIASRGRPLDLWMDAADVSAVAERIRRGIAAAPDAARACGGGDGAPNPVSGAPA